MWCRDGACKGRTCKQMATVAAKGRERAAARLRKPQAARPICEETPLRNLLIFLQGTVKHGLERAEACGSPAILDVHITAQVPDNTGCIRSTKRAST